ncbi:TonB-dependent receptor domain-containing protein [Sphingomonas xinjiangensis]|uniref:Outer membrane receptor protein involved in Fe transport n=1 Tax=Sphingomonas xinjiangensis TaxID=643568 RepID=A0A840YCA3_9SPHN|nr:TonB-dependent receptor [Sphingomonas xinjiangensis]MBB5709925.1 outer membrane receptor protein involved in Fe transport [Sphingomonas xinjiangensis]
MKKNALLLSSTCFAVLFAAPAFAQEANTTGGPVAETTANADTASTDEGSIVVTGSRISRPNIAAAAPITSVTSESIRAQAAVNIEEVLNRIPMIAPDSQQNYQDSDGRQRIKLRNLGFERTLVLVDGKRLGTQNGLDANMIPTSLIKRVDVLTGGASAVYGSDAIAGVVNFILDDNFEGIQLNGNYNFYAHENKPTIVSETARQYGFAQPRTGSAFDGGRVDLSLTAGTKLFDDRFHVSGYVNYRKADLVPYSARETSSCELQQTVKDGPLSCTVSTYTPNGYISPRIPGTPGTGGLPGTAPQYVNNPDGTRTFLPYSDAYAANPFDGLAFQRENERWNAGGFASFEISDAVEVYANAMWFRDESTNPYPARVLSSTAYAPGTTPYTINCNNPFMSAAQAQIVCGAAAGTGGTVPIEVRARFDNVPAINDSYLNQGVRVSGGLRGDFAQGWSYDVGGVYSYNKMDTTWGRPDFNRVNNALNVVNNNGTISCVNDVANGCVPFDPFSSNSAVNNTALFNYLTEGNFGTSTTENRLYNVIATVQGDLGTYGIQSPWAEEGVAIAIGAEFREDQLEGYADPIWRARNGGTDQSLSQHVWEGNVELQVPIAQHKPFADLLQVNGAYRLSKYSSNPDTFSTWKAEALWAPIPDITFRGSINRAQRAPTVVEAFQGSNISYNRIVPSFGDFCAPTVTFTTGANGQQVPVYGSPIASREVCAATGLADSLYGSQTLLCPTDIGCTTRSGGFTVDPETAYTKTFGLILKPRFLPGLVVSVDRFMIDLDDSIGYNDYSYFSNGCLATGSAFFCDAFVRNPDGTLTSNPTGNPATGYIRQGTTNYYKSKSHGWDFQGQYALPLGGAGRLDFDFSGSLTTLAGGQDSPALPEKNCVGYYGGAGCGQLIPKWSHNLRGTYTTQDRFFSASLNWRHLGPLTNVTNSGDPTLGWTQAGERATFNRIEAFDYFDLALSFRVNDGFSFRIAANNILDKTPPLFPNSYNVGSLSRTNTINSRYDSLGRQIAFGTTINF